jgi:ubiquinone/menaquinone biosynthesis C-methylase UbiE
MTMRLRRRFITPFVLLALAVAGSSAQDAQQNAADAQRVIAALELHAGSIVGEIGAGDGALTVAIARAVGPSGRVFSNEINTQKLAGIAKAAAAAGLTNVTTIAGGDARTNFEDRCCDAIFMRDVYHHFTDPSAMNASIIASLKPGGRLAVVDFGPPPGGESDTPAGRSADGHHGITRPTLERELTAAGFEILSSTDYGFRGMLVVAKRPAGTPPCQ